MSHAVYEGRKKRCVTSENMTKHERRWIGNQERYLLLRRQYPDYLLSKVRLAPRKDWVPTLDWL